MLLKLCYISVLLNFLFVVESEVSLGCRGYVLGNNFQPRPRFYLGLGRLKKPRPPFYLDLGEAALAEVEVCEAQPRTSEDPGFCPFYEAKHLFFKKRWKSTRQTHFFKMSQNSFI